MKGYKIFNPDWTCIFKQYTCPGEFEEDLKPIVCAQGMHFCETLCDCLIYKYCSYSSLTGKIAEVESYGDVDVYDDGTTTKISTNKLRIVRELSLEEVAEIIESELVSQNQAKRYLILLSLYWWLADPSTTTVFDVDVIDELIQKIRKNKEVTVNGTY